MLRAAIVLQVLTAATGGRAAAKGPAAGRHCSKILQAAKDPASALKHWQGHWLLRTSVGGDGDCRGLTPEERRRLGEEAEPRALAEEVACGGGHCRRELLAPAGFPSAVTGPVVISYLNDTVELAYMCRGERRGASIVRTGLVHVQSIYGDGGSRGGPEFHAVHEQGAVVLRHSEATVVVFRNGEALYGYAHRESDVREGRMVWRRVKLNGWDCADDFLVPRYETNREQEEQEEELLTAVFPSPAIPSQEENIAYIVTAVRNQIWYNWEVKKEFKDLRITHTWIQENGEMAGEPFKYSEQRFCNEMLIWELPSGSLPRRALASHSGSGNTWFRNMIEALTGLPTCEFLSSERTTAMDARRSYLLYKTHHEELGNHVSDCDYTVASELEEAGWRLRNTAFFSGSGVLLIRNPYDAIVSAWKHCRVGVGTQAYDIQSSTHQFQSFVFHQVDKWRQLAVDWLLLSSPGLTVVHYERMLKDPEGEVERVARFLRVDIDEGRKLCFRAFSFDKWKRKSLGKGSDMRATFDERNRRKIREAITAVQELLVMLGKDPMPLELYPDVEKDHQSVNSTCA